MNEFITDLRGADPLARAVESLVDCWQPPTNSMLLNTVRIHVTEEQLTDLSNVGSRIFLREQVCAVRAYYLYIRKHVIERSRVYRLDEDPAQRNRILALQTKWRSCQPLCESVQAVEESLEKAYRMGNIQLVTSLISQFANRTLNEERLEFLQAVGLEKLGHTEISRLASMLENFAHCRLKMLWNSQIARSLEELLKLPVEPSFDGLKGMFTLTPEQVLALRNAWMGIDSDMSAFETIPSEQEKPVAPPTVQSRISPGGIILVGR